MSASSIDLQNSLLQINEAKRKQQKEQKKFQDDFQSRSSTRINPGENVETVEQKEQDLPLQGKNPLSELASKEKVQKKSEKNKKILEKFKGNFLDVKIG